MHDIFNYITLVLGEPSFQHLADVDTPSGFCSTLEPNDHQLSSQSQADTGSVMSSTVVECGTLPNAEDLNFSSIPAEIHFCPRCGEIFQS